MPDKPGSLPVVLKVGVALALVAGAAMAAAFWLRPVVSIKTVVRGTAADGVPGSVVVHADGDIKEFKSEVAGRVESCDLLSPDVRFKKNDVVLKLVTADLDRAVELAKRAQAKEEEKKMVAYAKVTGWKEAREKLAAATKALDAGGSADEVVKLQAELDEIERVNNSELIVAKEAADNAERFYARREIAKNELDQRRRALEATDVKIRLAALAERQAKEDFKEEMRNKEIERERMSIRAPADGQVKEVMVFPGALISAGQVVATWHSDKRTVVAKISEEDISRVKLDQSANVTLLKFPNEYFKARVSKILTSADADTQRYTVYLDVDASLEKLAPFATGEVTIQVQELPDRLLIPPRAVFDQTYVSVVRDGRVERRKITLGLRATNQVEVVEGLALGDQVIVDLPQLFRNGKRVRTVVAQ